MKELRVLGFCTVQVPAYKSRFLLQDPPNTSQGCTCTHLGRVVGHFVYAHRLAGAGQQA